MTRYLIKKLIILLILLFLVSITVFSVLFVLPGDPAQIMLGTNATPETLANLRAELGLDQPFWFQYADWIYNLLNGTGSRSLNYDVPVYDLLLSSLAVTGPLALMAMFFAIVISVPLGIHAARHQNRPADVSVLIFTQLGLATPEFWLGILLMLLFSVYMLLRGHNEPGGGFIGGLIAAIGFALYAIAHGSAAARRVLRIEPNTIAMTGLGIALLAGGLLVMLLGFEAVGGPEAFFEHNADKLHMVLPADDPS